MNEKAFPFVRVATEAEAHPSTAVDPVSNPLSVVVTGSVAPFAELLGQSLLARGHRVDQVPSEQDDHSSSVYGGQHVDIAIDPLRQAVARADVTILLTGLGPLVATVDDAAALDTILGAARPGTALIELSSFGVFGDQGTSLIDEDSFAAPAAGAEPVLSAEIRTLASDDWLRTAVVRAGLVYGPGGGGLIEAMITAAQAAGRSEYIGNASDNYPLTHRDDLLDLLVKLVESPLGRGIFHAVGDEIQAGALAGLIAKAAGVAEVGAVSSSDVMDRHPRDLFSPRVPGRVNVRATTTRGELVGWAPTAPRLTEEMKDRSTPAD